jgi:hypothetical protein
MLQSHATFFGSKATACAAFLITDIRRDLAMVVDDRTDLGSLVFDDGFSCSAWLQHNDKMRSPRNGILGLAAL